MTSLHHPEPKQSSPAAKYGPIAGVIVVVALIAAFAVTRGKGNDSAAGGGGGSAVGSSAKDLPVLYNDAKKNGGDLSGYGDRCDTTTGRIKLPTIFAPPCVPVWKQGADNGGATSQGVTKDEITVVEYRPSTNGDLSSLLQGLLDKPEEVKQTQAAYEKLFSDMFESYGRKVKYIRYQSQGGMDDEVVAKADAIKIAEEYKAFAVLGGPALAQDYAKELAARKVICIGCGQGVPDSTYQKLAPYLWGAYATPEQFLLNLGDLITGRLNGKKAEFAGDPALQGQTRKFGVVHFEQKVPVYTELEDQVREEGKCRGWEAAASETYTLDLAKMGERATTIIAKMKAAGVTSIIFLGDPLMPISLTKAATEQNYFPEWIVTGTVLTDTNVFGRRYDQKQWAHAFGISSLPVKTPREMSEPWAIHQWYYGQAPAAKTTAPIIYSGLQQLYLGIHMAGPKLSPETFRDGLFNYPPTGGGPTSPHISFGMHGYFKPQNTCSSAIPKEERADYLGIDDVALIWWDAEVEGKDESGGDGKGLYRYMDGGKRYMPGAMPKTDLPVGKKDGSVTIVDSIPAADKGPDYPSPAQKLPPPVE